MRIVASIFFCFIVSILPIYASSDTESLRRYVGNLMDEGYQLVHDKTITAGQRYKKSSRLIRDNLYIDWMAKYTLGRNRRSLSSQKIKEFTAVYTKFVVHAYADLTNHYSGQRAVLTGIKKIDDDMFIVNMEIIRPSNQQSIKVDYLVHEFKTHDKVTYKIGDIITEGISILNSQQNEFNSVIASRGIDSLIGELKQKAKQKKSEHEKLAI